MSVTLNITKVEPSVSADYNGTPIQAVMSTNTASSITVEMSSVRNGNSAFEEWKIETGQTGATYQDFIDALAVPTDISQLEQRVDDLEEATDGVHLGVEPLQYYILARDN